MKHIDLFAGIGGFALPALWMNWQTIAFCERDEFCQQILRKNFGEHIPIYGDITTFSAKSFRGRCDIITGGFPCQPFSQAGKGKGRGDERHLFPEMLRIIREVRPRWIVAENVRRILTIEHGEVFEEICSSLEGEGYSVTAFCLPACAVDAPHRRDRIWFIAHSDRSPLCRRCPTSTGRDVFARCTCCLNSDTGSTGLQGRQLGRTLTERTWTPRSITERFENEHWLEAATRICAVDDGLSRRLARPKGWLTNAFKAAGNAVHPLVALEIFKAIQEVENSL